MAYVNMLWPEKWLKACFVTGFDSWEVQKFSFSPYAENGSQAHPAFYTKGMLWTFPRDEETGYLP
jgi:hypothetical protein